MRPIASALLALALYAAPISAQFTPRTVALTPGASVAINASLGSIFTLTPGQDETVTVTYPGRRTFYLFLTQTGTSRTLTFSTGFTGVTSYSTGIGSAVCSLAFQGTGLTAREVGGTCRGYTLGAPSSYQASDADLDCLAALSSTGIFARTGSGTCAVRSLTGTANEITITNGDGVSGAPTFSIAATVDFSGKTSTKPSKSGTLATIPASCTVGDTYFCTDCSAGLNLYGCTATNVWTLLGDGGGAGVITSINSQGGPAITIAAGSTGSDVNIATTTNTVTVHVPDAGAAARGVITTGAQTIAGAKTFSSTIGGSISGNAATVTGLSVTAGKTLTATETLQAGGRLAQVVTASSASTITFSSIPGTCTDLRIGLKGRDTATGTAGASVRIKFNGDGTAGNYTASQYLIGTGASTAAGSDAATSNGFLIASIPGSLNNANALGAAEIVIPGYANTTFHKPAFSTGHAVSAAGPTLDVVAYSGTWKSTAAITSITITAGVTAFVDGTTATLYCDP